MKNRHCFALVASRLRSEDYINWLYKSMESVRDVLGEPLGVIDDSSLDTIVPRARECTGLVLFVATGGTEHILLELREKLKEKPVLVVALPYANSLPAVMEAAPLLRRYRRTAIHYLDGFDEASLYSLKTALKGLVVASSVQGIRLGVIGGISPWLVYSRLSDDDAKKIGIELVDIKLSELNELYERLDPSEELLKTLMGNADRVKVPVDSVKNALRVYSALKALIERYHLGALTIKCFDLISTLRTTACLALSLLNSSGFVAGCEGDVPSTITMILLSRVSGKPAFMANPARIREQEVLFAHCTAPVLYGPYWLLTHFESGIGVGVSVKYPAGVPVTIARLDPASMRLRVAVGVIEASGYLSDRHCRTQLLVRLRGAKNLLDRSIGNHYVIVPGKYVEELRYTAKLLGLGFEELGQER